MAHTDPYRLTPSGGASGGADEARGGAGDPGVVRFLLWPALVISVIGNTVVSWTGAGLGAHLAFGAVTALTVTALVVRRLRSGR
ncbi:hypothetical protein [Streptomyces naganishii]|uniref:Uncharacterized protein n=1 Tax=Streptomyces naganishii JCM 4654 TaxID=1306179 RepID=A0A919CVU6_9ACTN|nr:hypothetical protein [Streptomyces naganishii]GHD87097.1 hypothetical protein GCM10010508_17550 [Streptomyces naganishii JCM 4654]